MANGNKSITAVSPVWNTIQIFGYGEVVISNDTSTSKVTLEGISALSPVITALTKKQQAGTTIELDSLRTLNIYKGYGVDFQPKAASNNKPQRFAWSDIDTNLIENLASEISSKVTPRKPNTAFKDLLKKFSDAGK